MASLLTIPTSMLRDIRVLHVESTDVCQAACPLCARETDSNFDKSLKHHLTVDQICSVFSNETLSGLDKMFMCGNYGDPAAGNHTLEIYRYFRSINADIVLGMNTNGAIQNIKWWKELAEIFNQPLDYVVFSIDGLEDTNSIYRINVSWQKVMDNAKAFINAGGSAHWDMLVYEHNQHQVAECEQLARDLGFTWFRAKVSKRPFINSLKFPQGWQPSHGNTGPIKCHALQEKSAYIDAQARMFPCCWLGSTQQDFTMDFQSIVDSWSTTPNPVCQRACSTNVSGTNFSNQWQREIQLC